MTRLTIPIIVALATSVATVGCDRDHVTASGVAATAATATPTAKADSPPETIQSLPEVDTKDLSDQERQTWVALVNDVLSPCGQPVSVARCVKEGVRCSKCVTAARFVKRLVKTGLSRAEVRQQYRDRYAPETEVHIETKGEPVRGSPMAPVTIVVFSDFECPFCKAAEPKIMDVLRQFEGRVRVIFKQFPLSMHPNSMDAAIASLAAAKQGKFWQMHDVLFEHQHAQRPEDLLKYAKQIGLDVEQFKKDIKEPAIRAHVDANRKEGEQLGVTGTPAIFVDNRRFKEPTQYLTAYVREELDE